jgi:hypothetical protein
VLTLLATGGGMLRHATIKELMPVSIIWHHLSVVIPDARLRAIRNP